MENTEESCIEPYYPSIDEEVVGFDDDAKNITKYLRRGNTAVDIVSIVGMTGIGKTALARKIYNSRSIIDHFDIRAWCSVSQTYNRRELVLQILKQMTDDHHSNYVDLDCPEYILQRSLKPRKYLIVLDNIWEVQAWDCIELCFPDEYTGSRIMVTTRNKEVARKCKGLPSLIIMIAEILSREREASSWLKVAYDISSYVSDEEMSMKTIQSSYDHLPDHLKPCLLYMGLFPKDYEIPVSDLLNWWIAEEFVQSIDTWIFAIDKSY
ncbi:hypothetical protein KY290_023962 [Solanum tuberosum]|uniref:NB-ARC domain-containing protein n=1 Tax=Solanum tuberosum TaxID=4113 RepID=A0ABQ7UPC5_SOLTU|nr:hypothetical protein KY284_022862 [Solanum tuberosum]KAH0753692.1 hypothetical protein KY290_023962 [Solanum tuberosum]